MFTKTQVFLSLSREELLMALEVAGVSNPVQAIADGMTVQALVRVLESYQGKQTGDEIRWQREMRR